MLFFVRHGDQEFKVRIESRQNQLHIQFEEEPEEAGDLYFYGHNCSYIKDGDVFYGNVVGKKGEYTVWDPRGNVDFTVESEYRRIVGKLRGRAMENENRVTAKMPGKIVKVFVKTGDAVTKGQTVVIMEAMKMENEIQVSVDGEVQSVLVSEGQAVESGDVLIELKD